MSSDPPKQLKDYTEEVSNALKSFEQRIQQLELKDAPNAAQSSPTSSSSLSSSLSSDPDSDSSSLTASESSFLSPSSLSLFSPTLFSLIEDFLSLEKRTRLSADAKSSALLVEKFFTLLFHQKHNSNSGEYPFLPTVRELMSIVSKRRAQLQRVIEVIVTCGHSLLLEIPEKFPSVRKDLMVTLRIISNGKIFVELERARITLLYAQMEEKKGNVSEAAEVIQEIQVETIGSMEIKEKISFFLYQISLCLMKKDYVRAEIIAKKVDTKTLNVKEKEKEKDTNANVPNEVKEKKEEKKEKDKDIKKGKEEIPSIILLSMEELKIQFYRLQIIYYTHSASYYHIAMAWREILSCEITQNSPSLFKESITNCILFAILSPFDSEISDYLHRLKVREEKKLSHFTIYKTLLESICSEEIIGWPIKYEGEIKSHDTFSKELQGDEEETPGNRSNTTPSPSSPSVSSTYDSTTSSVLFHNRVTRWSDFHKRIVQHNLRCIAKYYEKITIFRLAEILNLSKEKCEEYVCELVSTKQMGAKLDRCEGIITFHPKVNESVTLGQWVDGLHQMLNKVEHTQHLIQKENMRYKIQ